MVSQKRANLPFILFTAAALIGLVCPVLIQDGMFMDAMLYTSVAHNLSQGVGTFWFPQFSAHNVAGLGAFHEQPPLVFGIQALFFSALGSSMYVERTYTFLTLLLAAWLIVLTWRRIVNRTANYSNLSWFPVFLWITIPVCFWSYSNNMHENTMTVFCLLAVLMTVCWMQEKKGWQLVLAGAAVFFASFSKGVPGLFPIGVPLIYHFTIGKTSIKKSLTATTVLLIVPVVSYGLMCLSPEARESLSTYFFKRAIHRMNDQPTAESHFYIIGKLFTELIPQLAFVTIILLAAGKAHIRAAIRNRPAWFFLATGLAGSLPLMITLVQKGFYLVPAMPFFGLGFAAMTVPAVSTWTGRIAVRLSRLLTYTGAAAVLVSVAITLRQAGRTSRNEEMLHDVYEIGAVVPPRSIVSIPAELWNQWDLQCYLMRYFQISVEAGEGRTFYLAGRRADSLPAGYTEVEIPTVRYGLFRKE